MLVSEAVVARRSIRQFTDTPVPNDTIRDLLERAARAPSGGNLQDARRRLDDVRHLTFVT